MLYFNKNCYQLECKKTYIVKIKQLANYIQDNIYTEILNGGFIKSVKSLNIFHKNISNSIHLFSITSKKSNLQYCICTIRSADTSWQLRSANLKFNRCEANELK